MGDWERREKKREWYWPEVEIDEQLVRQWIWLLCVEPSDNLSIRVQFLHIVIREKQGVQELNAGLTEVRDHIMG